MNKQDHETKAPNGAPKRPVAGEDADRIADRLAAAAAPPAAAAGAADPEASGPVLTDLLGHSLASSHRVMMRFAIVANTVMDWPKIKADLDDPAPPTVHYTATRSDIGRSTAADLAAARTAASCGRVMDTVRLGLVAWGSRRPPINDDGHWEGVGFQGFECSETEYRRRLNEAKAAKAACDAAEGRTGPGLSDFAKKLRAAANHQSIELVEETETERLARRVADADGGKFMRRLFAHELAAIHGLKMRLDGGANWALDQAIELAVEPVAACRLAVAAARLGDRFRRGLAALTMYDKSPGGAPTEPNTFWVGPDGGYIPPGPYGSPDNMPPAPSPATAPAGHGVERPRLYATDPTLRRGRLANGNPSGDFLASPRCGARARHGGACRQPAMANGRCRFHGGKSTGPRTVQGLARARAARLVHGGYSAEIIDLRKEAALRVRRLRALIAADRQTRNPAGHGVDRCVAPSAGPTSSYPALAIPAPGGYEPGHNSNPHAGCAARRGEIPAVAPVFQASARRSGPAPAAA